MSTGLDDLGLVWVIEKPEVPTVGDIFYSHKDSMVYYYNGSEWINVALNVPHEPQNPCVEISEYGNVEGLPGLQETVKHPVTKIQSSVYSIIINLNDQHKWSREKIADWLEEISDPTGENGPDIRVKEGNRNVINVTNKNTIACDS